MRVGRILILISCKYEGQTCGVPAFGENLVCGLHLVSAAADVDIAVLEITVSCHSFCDEMHFLLGIVEDVECSRECVKAEVIFLRTPAVFKYLAVVDFFYRRWSGQAILLHTNLKIGWQGRNPHLLASHKGHHTR